MSKMISLGEEHFIIVRVDMYVIQYVRINMHTLYLINR